MLGFLYSYLIMLAELYAIGELKRKARAPCHSRQPFLSVAHIHPDAPPPGPASPSSPGGHPEFSRPATIHYTLAEV